MARFLFATWEGGGHVQPMLSVAAGLKARGHQVLAMSDAANAPDAAALGVAFRAWTTAPSLTDKARSGDRLRDWEADNPLQIIQDLLGKVVAGPAGAYATDVLEALKDFPADVVVSQELLFGAMIAAEAAGLPLAILTANVWPFPTLPGAPPFGTGMSPATNDDERGLHAMVSQTTRTIFQMGLPDLNAARADLGLMPLADLFDQLAYARAVLLASSRAFDFAPEPLAEPFRYVGPYLGDPVDVAGWTPPWPADDRPLVVVSSSTLYEGQEGWLGRVIEALGALPVHGLVTLGPSVDPGRFDPPANVSVVRSAPHSQVLPRAAAMVTHGGHGSVLRGLMAGVPLLLLPAVRDQADNAARVTARGAGLSLSRDASPEALAAAIRRLLDEPAFRRQAQALGAAIAADVDGRSAEEALERLV
jgi:MGT family glycosyltransferase